MITLILCDFLGWHRWERGGMFSQLRGQLLICDRCSAYRWRR